MTNFPVVFCIVTILCFDRYQALKFLDADVYDKNCTADFTVLENTGATRLDRLIGRAQGKIVKF